MVLDEEDFPVVAMGFEVWSKRRLFPLLIADSHIVAAQVAIVLNMQAESERPFSTTERWLSVQ